MPSRRSSPGSNCPSALQSPRASSSSRRRRWSCRSGNTEAPTRGMEIDEQPLLEIRGLTKTFPGVRALQGVDFPVRRGEVHALMGENGAGKSTLIKVLTGVYRRDSGEMSLDGKLIDPHSPQDAERLGISTVYQEVNLVPFLSVAENICLGRQKTKLVFIN